LHFRPALLAWRKFPEDKRRILSAQNAFQVTTYSHDIDQPADSYTYYTQYGEIRYGKLHIIRNYVTPEAPR